MALINDKEFEYTEAEKKHIAGCLALCGLEYLVIFEAESIRQWRGIGRHETADAVECGKFWPHSSYEELV